VKDPKKGGFTKAQRDAVVARLEKSALLNEVRQFIFSELKPADPASASIVHQADCRQLVRFIGEKLGKDLRHSVLRDFNTVMAGWLKAWVAEASRDRHLTENEAKQFLLERIMFVAECEGRAFSHFYPIEDIQAGCDVHEKADDAAYETRVMAEMQVGSQAAKHVIVNTSAVVATTTSARQNLKFPHPLAFRKRDAGLTLDENDKKTIFFDDKAYKCQPYHWDVLAFCDHHAKLLRAGKTEEASKFLVLLPDHKIRVSMRKVIEEAAPEKAKLSRYLKHGTFFKEMDLGLKKKLFATTGQQHFLIWLPNQPLPSLPG
jgi:hypothetical protein